MLQGLLCRGWFERQLLSRPGCQVGKSWPLIFDHFLQQKAGLLVNLLVLAQLAARAEGTQGRIQFDLGGGPLQVLDRLCIELGILGQLAGDAFPTGLQAHLAINFQLQQPQRGAR